MQYTVMLIIIGIIHFIKFIAITLFFALYLSFLHNSKKKEIKKYKREIALKNNREKNERETSQISSYQYFLGIIIF